MLDQNHRAAAQSKPIREQLFTERYETLLSWALHLTRGQQRESAEDLVQDAFVQFMLARTRLEEIENINGYLRQLLRNMYLSRMTRLAPRLHDTPLSIADYDTFRLGWTAIEAPRRMQAAEELHQICTYSCFRKESSRAGSVLILRFFLDYFPTEIASVLGSSRHCVDQWQRLARQEVKVFMKEPHRLRFVDTKLTAARTWTRYPASDCDLMLALRTMIFDSRQGPCLSKEELTAAYATGKADALSTGELAHIVSCRSCLDTVNVLLGLPLLAERYPGEDCDRDEPPSSVGDGGSGGINTTLPKRFARRLREVREHKPSELRIAVNGISLSSLKISSQLSEFDLLLPAGGPVEFIEVLSEQDVQLLFLSVNDTASGHEQWARIELSDERTLEVSLQPAGAPRLHVVYNDPAATNELINERTLSSPPLTAVSQPRARRLLEVLRNALRRRVVAEESGGSAAISSLGLLGKPARPDRAHVWKSPAWLTVLIATAMIGAFLLYQANLNTTPAATTLLAQAMIAETKRTNLADRVGHHSINLEIRRSSEGAVISRHTIASWENYERRQRIQRLYDESGRLIAAASQNAAGVRLLYHHGSKAPRPLGATPDSLLLDLNDVWQLTPSVHDYNAITAGAAAFVQQTATGYVVKFDKERTIGASRLLKATLTLAKSDLHAVEQTLVVQRGEELREYKFVVTNSELLAAREVAPSVFKIDPQLAVKTVASGNSGNTGLRGLTTTPSSPTSITAIASTELEIDVAYLLNLVKADRNEQVALTRSASGSLRVEGVVDNASRREEFLRALAPFSNNPAVIIEIRTLADAAKQQPSGGRELIKEVDATDNTIAVNEELRTYFLRRGLSGETIDESVRTYSSRVVNHSYRALFHVIELKRLVARFARADMRTVAPDARKKWLEMLQEHALAYSREAAALRRELQPVFFSDTGADASVDVTIEDDADLNRAVERLHRLALANNEAIRQAFIISTESSAAAFKSLEFRSTFEGAARLSNRIAQYSR